MDMQAVQELSTLESEVHLRPVTPPHQKNLLRGIVSGVLSSIPTGLVLAGIGLVAWWGHNYGWKVPKFSELKGQVAEKDDWCDEHHVPESACVECDETLLPKHKPLGWCETHGIPECTLDHPELAQVLRTPDVKPTDLDKASRSLAFAARTPNNPNCQTHLRRIQFTTAHDADKAGIAVEPVWTSPALEYVSGPGELGYDQTRIANLSTRAPGTIWKVYKHLGDEVRAGELLAILDATEVGKLKAELMQALATYHLKNTTLANIKDTTGVIPPTRVREVEASVQEAEIRVTASCQSLSNLGLSIQATDVLLLKPREVQEQLRWLGIPPEHVKSLGTTATTNLLPLIAPLDGRIMSREVVPGEVVDMTRILFNIVDTRHLWLTLDIRGEDAHRVTLGQTVKFRPDNGRAELTGKIVWRNPQADPRTRTVKVRANLYDPDQKLVSNTFGTGKIILRDEPKVISVPNEAIQWEGCCQVVFVRDKHYLKSDYKVFHIRKVRIGAKDDKNTEIIAGLLPGELVATRGSGLLLTELLRGTLGEGCACHSKK